MKRILPLIVLWLSALFGYAQRVKFESKSPPSIQSTDPVSPSIVNTISLPSLYWQQGNKILVYGAIIENEQLQYGLLQYNPETQTTDFVGTSPTQMINGAMVWQDKSSNLWFYGGTDGTGFELNSTFWKWDKSLKTWSKAAQSVSPSARSKAQMWEDSTHVWLFGGEVMDSLSGLPKYFNDLWHWDKNTFVWSSIVSPQKPSERSNGVVWFDSTARNLYLYGGFGASPNSSSKAALDDMWRFNIATNTWQQVQASTGDFVKKRTIFDNNRLKAETGEVLSDEMPGFRYGAKSWQVGNSELWLWGGQVSNAQEDPLLWKYDLNSGKWRSIIGYQYPSAEDFAKVYVGTNNQIWLLGKTQSKTKGIIHSIYEIKINTLKK